MSLWPVSSEGKKEWKGNSVLCDQPRLLALHILVSESCSTGLLLGCRRDDVSPLIWLSIPLAAGKLRQIVLLGIVRTWTWEGMYWPLFWVEPGRMNGLTAAHSTQWALRVSTAVRLPGASSSQERTALESWCSLASTCRGLRDHVGNAGLALAHSLPLSLYSAHAMEPA